jgi:DNA helicase-2/ATP-dependent DNA helicase PcrA
LGEIPPDLVDRETTGAHPPGGWASAAAASAAVGIRPRASASWASMRSDNAPASASTGFRVGDDVLHAAFGEGVVTGTEPGGVVTIRFARDGSERKLMAEYAPLEKR